MATVTIQGNVHGEPVRLRWVDGTVSGDSLFLAAVTNSVEGGGDAWLTPTGPSYQRGTTDGWQFLATALSVVDDPAAATYSVSGLQPQPTLPEGAEG
jgi:hypothetical protein